ncbi:unnamed protein product [Phytomonas sp. Hart1]|nr:unnamed protein product [Phytomonas sp. Hart1]|eukprot:CCW66810.1 unnamed protein product [Phytomonas sp. isolate Hart1]
MLNQRISHAILHQVHLLQDFLLLLADKAREPGRGGGVDHRRQAQDAAIAAPVRDISALFPPRRVGWTGGNVAIRHPLRGGGAPCRDPIPGLHFRAGSAFGRSQGRFRDVFRTFGEPHWALVVVPTPGTAKGFSCFLRALFQI